MSRSVRSVLSAFVLFTLGACAIHEAEPAFRATAFIGDRGISVPLPPPSLVSEPQQEVHVQGSVFGLEGDGEDLRVHMFDQVGGASAEVPLTADATFQAEGLSLDLTDHCLELWVEDAEGQQGEHLTYRAVIGEDDQTIAVVEGCE
ncbi:MAG: hypothetical protein AAGF11_45960 [Myxococcota bacterium]